MRVQCGVAEGCHAGVPEKLLEAEVLVFVSCRFMQRGGLKNPCLFAFRTVDPWRAIQLSDDRLSYNISGDEISILDIVIGNPG